MDKQRNAIFKKPLALFLVFTLLLGTLPEMMVYGEGGDSGLILGEDDMITAFEALPQTVASQSVTMGTPQDALALPDTLEAEVDIMEMTVHTPTDAEADGVAVTVPVAAWQSSPEYDGDASGLYIFTPELSGEYTVAQGVALPTISVTVEAADAPSEPVTIAAFAPLADDVALQNVTIGTVWESLALPDTLKATAWGGETDAYTVNVGKWECLGIQDETGKLTQGGYDPDTPGVYTFAPVLALKDNEQLSGELNSPLPTVEVVVTENMGIMPLALDVSTADYSFVTATGTLTVHTNAATVYDGANGWRNNGGNFAAGDIKAVVIGNGVTSIGAAAFWNCPGISGTLTIPSSVISIGNAAFSRCTGIAALNLPTSGSLAIGAEAFVNCTGISGTLTIPSSVTSIGGNAFRDCAGISGTLTIPFSVTSIGSSAFNGTNITAFVFTGATAPTMDRSIRNSFAPSYYPSGGAASYLAQTGLPQPAYPYSGMSPAAPSITTASLPNGEMGTAYSQTLAATGDGAFTWSIASGDLPGGLTLTSAGVLSGTPAVAGTFTFTVKAANGITPDATKVFSLTVSGISPTSATFDKNTANANYRDITIMLTAGSHTLSAIRCGSNTLQAGTDYTVSGNTCTIKKEYLSTLDVGTQTVTFDMNGGKDWELAITVSVATSVTALTLSVSPSSPLTLPDSVTLTATLSGAYPDNSGKTVTFTVNGASYTATTNTSGVATHTLTNPAAGTYTFSASYAGDSNNAPSTANNITGYSVGLGAQAALTLNGLNNAYTYGDAAFSLSTSGGSGGGAVTYTSSDSTVASVLGNTVTIHKAGTFTITATKAGDSNYNQASVTSGTVTVSKATPNVELAASGTVAGSPLILTVTVSKAGAGVIPSGSVTFKDGTTQLGTGTLDASGMAAYVINSPDGANHSYTAEYPGDADHYNASSVTISYIVGKANQAALSITGVPVAVTYGDNGFALGTMGGSGDGLVTFDIPVNNVLAVTSGGAVTITDAGSVTVTVTKAGDATYNEISATLDITVLPRDISKVTAAVTGGRVYTGSQLQPVFTVSDGQIPITSGDYTNVYGANIDVGVNGGSVTLTGQRNYTGTKTVNFDIEPRSLTGAVITLADTSFTYTGRAITPAVTSVVAGGVTVPTSEYDVAYSNNTKVGTATVTVTAKAASANITDNESTTFAITARTGGGSSSDDSDNDSSYTPTYSVAVTTKPDSSTLARTTLTSSPDKNAVLSYTITKDMVQQALDKAQAEAQKQGGESCGYSLEFHFSTTATIDSLNITFNADALALLESAGIKEATVTTNAFRFGLNLAAVEELNKQRVGNAVTVTASRFGNFSDAAKEYIGDRPAWDITISYKNGGKTENISNFGKGAITMGMKYTPALTEITGNLVVVCVADSGEPQVLTESSYDNGWMIWQRNSLSVYGVGYIPPSGSIST